MTSSGMGDRMKEYEKAFDQHLDPGKFYMLRLDGIRVLRNRTHI